MHSMSTFQYLFISIFLSPVTYVVLLAVILVGLYFLCRSIFRRSSRFKGDREALARYRNTLAEYERWMSGFPDIKRVLENLRAQAEGAELNGGTPHGNENCTVDGLRRQVLKLRGISAWPAR